MRSLTRAACLALAALLFFFVPRGGTAVVRAAGPSTFGGLSGECTYSFGESSTTFGSAGGTGIITVLTQPDCEWTVEVRDRFLKFTEDDPGYWWVYRSGTGSGTVPYAVEANVRGRRTGTITISLVYHVPPRPPTLAVFTVHQDGKAVHADFTGDGKGDLAVFRPSSGTWVVQGAADSQFGGPGVIPVPGDYDGDGTVDKAVYRPWDAVWEIATGAPIPFGLPGDLPVAADYDADGTTDLAVFRTVSGAGQWYVRGQGGPFVLGARGDIPVPEDYDGDGRTDLAVYRPSNATWYIASAATGFATTTEVHMAIRSAYGAPPGDGYCGDIPVPGDYDSDGKADLAVFRACLSVSYVQLSRRWDGHIFDRLGVRGDVPMAFDLDGNGSDDLVFYRPSTGQWMFSDFFDTSGHPTFEPAGSLGGPGDIPVAQRPRRAHVNPGDFDGDGISDVTMFQPSSGAWSTRLSAYDFNYNAATAAHTLGQTGDIKAPGDYDGDGKADYAIWRPSDGTWHLDVSTGASRTIQWGLGFWSDVPVPADYDGDGRTDIAVWRPSSGIWYILDSSSDYQTPRFMQWGLGFFSDVPVPGDFDGDGRADLAVYRPEPGLWYLWLSSGSVVVRQWGLGLFDDVPLVGDFDGDGRAEITVYRPAPWPLWYSMDPLTGATLPVRQFGLPGDIPLIEDVDGDGRTDLAVYRPSGPFWFFQRSRLGFYGPFVFGAVGGEPLLRIR